MVKVKYWLCKEWEIHYLRCQKYPSVKHLQILNHLITLDEKYALFKTSSILGSFVAGTSSSGFRAFPLLCLTLIYLLVNEDEVISTRFKT